MASKFSGICKMCLLLKDGFEWMGKVFKWRIYLRKRFNAEFEDSSLTRDLVRGLMWVGAQRAGDKTSRRLWVVPICCDLILIGCVSNGRKTENPGKPFISLHESSISSASFPNHKKLKIKEAFHKHLKNSRKRWKSEVEKRKNVSSYNLLHLFIFSLFWLRFRGKKLSSSVLCLKSARMKGKHIKWQNSNGA